MGIEANILKISKQQGDIESFGTHEVPDVLQEISFSRVVEAMNLLDCNNDRIHRVLFSLLDNVRPSWYRAARENGLHFSDGAQQAHISCHIGILQENNPDQRRKIDREHVRDEAIFPLIRLGIIERVFHDSGEFLSGHLRANSGSNCYRLTQTFIRVLQANAEDLRSKLEEWSGMDNEIQRAIMSADALSASTERIGSPHANLIQDIVEIYVPNFLLGFQVVYIDVGDGTRVTDGDTRCLADAGLGIERGDAFPDVLLWNPETDELWVIEAVVSDGEVDFHKVQRMNSYCERYGKSGVNYTTVYEDWTKCGRRQNRHRNIHPSSYLWIRNDPSKHFLCE